MTRGEQNRPPGPGMATAAGRSGVIGAWCFWAPLLVAFAFVIISTRPALADKPGGLPEGNLVDIKIEGLSSITPEQVRGKIRSRVGRPIDPGMIDSDLRALDATHWFSDTKIYYEESPDGKGPILVIRVIEMPVLKDVQFIGLIQGMGHVKLKDIEEATQLKKGARADSMKAMTAVHQIQQLYEEKGYEKAEVRLLEGGKVGDTRVVIEIFEGPKFKIDSIDFVGNTFVDDGVLATKIESRRGYFGLLGAKRQKEGLENDKRALYKYYQDNGYFDVHVSAVSRPGKDLGQEQIVFTISEGAQYKVKDIVIEGNKQITEAKLREGMMLKPGDPFNEAVRDLDYKTLSTKYWAIGCIETNIVKDQPVTDEPGYVRVVYRIEEGNSYILGQLIVRGNARTKDKVVRREALMAGLLPGEILDQNRIDTFKRRLGSTGYFTPQPNAPGTKGTKGIDIQIINKRSGDKPFGEDVLTNPNGLNLTRMQSPEQENPPAIPPIDVPPAMPPLEPQSSPLPGPASTPVTPATPATGTPGPQGAIPFGSDGIFDPVPNTVPPNLGTPPQTPPPVFPQRPPGALNPAQEPSLPNNNMNDVGPDRQEPFPGRSYADIVANVDEAATGRLMFGVGASSFGGLSGTAILHESNFDIWAIPRSFSELTSGRAFRGAGQELRISLSPGTLMQQYIVSFRDPYLFDQPLGLGLSGYETSRFYPDFSERRAGGRFSLGYQFGPQIYADAAFRVEDVDIHGFKYPAPADLLAAAGHTTLATLRPAIRFDNRNNPVSPTQGSYLEAAFEQGWGTFTYPKFTIEGKQHFTVGKRPDDSGKRTLTMRGRFGITGRDTPIYERFFAGDYRSMRGFYYRGVGPHILGVNTGGIMEAVSSIEYQFPWTASDKLQQVIFCDFGTVEANYSFTTFRAAIGTGLRVVIPQITGQLPLAFDLAFPVAKAEGDRVRYFSFFVGAFW
jgi:outer membrane protein insertion porin family